MSGRLGGLVISDFVLDQLERAVVHSFEARRGPLYNALRALNAAAIQAIAVSSIQTTSDAVVGDSSGMSVYNDAKKLILQALKNQMEPEIYDEFRFSYCLGLAKRFKGPSGITARLEALIPPFAEEFSAREAANDLEPHGGLLRWCLGMQEVGRIEALLQFASQTLFWTADQFPSSRYGDLERRLNVISDQLPS